MICFTTLFFIIFRYEKKILEATLSGISLVCEFSESSSDVVALINSATVINPLNDNFVLIAKKVVFSSGNVLHKEIFIIFMTDFSRWIILQAIVGDNSLFDPLPFVNVHFNIQKSDQSCKPLIKVLAWIIQKTQISLAIFSLTVWWC